MCHLSQYTLHCWVCTTHINSTLMLVEGMYIYDEASALTPIDGNNDQPQQRLQLKSVDVYSYTLSACKSAELIINPIA